LEIIHVSTVFKDVKKAAKKNKIAQLEGFGEKSQEDIVKAIDIYLNRQQKEERMLLPIAYSLSQKIIEYMKKNTYVGKIEVLGSLRRMVATIGDIDLAVVGKPYHSKDIIEHFISYPDTISVEGKGNTKATIILSGGKHADLRVIDKERFGSMLQYFTGSKAHNIKMREYALKNDYSLSEYGIKEKKKSKRERIHSFQSEEAFYTFLGLQWIPPEIREGTDEVERAQKGTIPRLVEPKDIKGDFHIHSSFNIEPSHDRGSDDFRKLTKKAEDLKYSYIAFSEHNPSQSNHKEQDIINLIKKKQEAIKQLKTSVTCFNSLEVDILPDGSLALPDAALKYLDFIIISIHSVFRMNKNDMTKRILKALSCPKVKVLGHPTGRLLSKREEIEADWTMIFTESKKRNIALAIDAWPDRLDLPDSMVRLAVDKGNLLAIDSDAHAVDQMENMLYGVSVARRGWAKKHDIINTNSLKNIQKWLNL